MVAQLVILLIAVALLLFGGVYLAIIEEVVRRANRRTSGCFNFLITTQIRRANSVMLIMDTLQRGVVANQLVRDRLAFLLDHLNRPFDNMAARARAEADLHSTVLQVLATCDPEIRAVYTDRHRQVARSLDAYNAAVNSFNALIARGPARIIARRLKLKPYERFELIPSQS